MLARKMTECIERWRSEQDRKPKAFLPNGARLTDKTFTICAFARRHSTNYVVSPARPGPLCLKIQRL